jgi:hypothetical protein
MKGNAVVYRQETETDKGQNNEGVDKEQMKEQNERDSSEANRGFLSEVNLRPIDFRKIGIREGTKKTDFSKMGKEINSQPAGLGLLNSNEADQSTSSEAGNINRSYELGPARLQLTDTVPFIGSTMDSRDFLEAVLTPGELAELDRKDRKRESLLARGKDPDSYSDHKLITLWDRLGDKLNSFWKAPWGGPWVKGDPEKYKVGDKVTLRLKKSEKDSEKEVTGYVMKQEGSFIKIKVGQETLKFATNKVEISPAKEKLPQKDESREQKERDTGRDTGIEL